MVDTKKPLFRIPATLRHWYCLLNRHFKAPLRGAGLNPKPQPPHGKTDPGHGGALSRLSTEPKGGSGIPVASWALKFFGSRTAIGPQALNPKPKHEKQQPQKQ